MEKQFSYVAAGSRNQNSHFGELVSRHVPYDLAIPRLDSYPNGKHDSHKKMCA